MSYPPLLLFSLLSIVVMGLLALVIFILSFKEKNRLYSSSLKQWSLAFVVLTCHRQCDVFGQKALVFNQGFLLKITGFDKIRNKIIPRSLWGLKHLP